MASSASSRPGVIDQLMERASLALEATRYFEVERLALDALARAHKARDYERMARIVLPLQEARRQKRQIAVDAAFLGPAARGATIVDHRRRIPEPVPGCYLFQPPLVGIDALHFAAAADTAEVPVLVLCREPLTRDGLWPLVATGVMPVRVKVPPPVPVQRVEGSITKDNLTSEDGPRISRAWFEAWAEALGDAAIAKLRPDDPAAWKVEDLLEFLSAQPTHEKLHQRLQEACRRAMHEPEPTGVRRRGVHDDPYSF